MKKVISIALVVQAIVIIGILIAVNVATNEQPLIETSTMPLKASDIDSKLQIKSSSNKFSTHIKDNRVSTDNHNKNNELGLDSEENIVSNIEAWEDVNVSNEVDNSDQSQVAEDYQDSSDSRAKSSGRTDDSAATYIIENNDKTSKQIKLVEVEVTKKQKNKIKKIAGKLKNKKENNSLKPISTKDLSNNFTIANDLGMANVPVMDQGPYGTCVAFATTAILDAKMNAGDYISQQCFLALGVYASEVASKSGQTLPSGWTGYWNELALSAFKNYGVVGKQACPEDYPNTSYSLPYNMYINLSGQLWSSDFNYRTLETNDINKIKQAIDNNNRVAIGILLHKDYIIGVAINNKPSGLWKISNNNIDEFVDEIINGDKLAGGHAVVVTGYDDTKQLLKVRNSWGNGIGDNGEFYMTYDYYELMNVEAIEVY